MLASANHQPKLIKQYAKDLVEQFPDSIYSDAARLSLAKLAVSNHDYENAVNELQWVAMHSKTPELADVAKIRLARLWFVHKDYSKALEVLNGVHSKVYLTLVDELKGDIYTGMNQFDKAVGFYRKALSEVQNYGVGNLFLEMKSNDLSTASNKRTTSLALKK
jgi:predicted negative regulator of RcsB-dependent stress response